MGVRSYLLAVGSAVVRGASIYARLAQRRERAGRECSAACTVNHGRTLAGATNPVCRWNADMDQSRSCPALVKPSGAARKDRSSGLVAR